MIEVDDREFDCGYCQVVGDCGEYRCLQHDLNLSNQTRRCSHEHVVAYHYKRFEVGDEECVSPHAKMNHDLIGGDVNSEEELKKIRHQLFTG